MTSDPHALELPDDEQPTDTWPWWPRLRRAAWAPDKHDDTEARADK